MLYIRLHGSCAPEDSGLGMVRLKARYVLFEILYPSPGTAVADGKHVLQALRSSIETNFGELGTGRCQSTLAVRYYNPKTSSGIIRIAREQAPIVQGALTHLRQIKGSSVVVRVTHVSGTMKKCEQRAVAIRRAEIVRRHRQDTAKMK